MLLGLALTDHRKSIIFRREFPQFREIILRIQEIVGDKGNYNASSKVIETFDHRMVEFGAVQYPADVRKFQGRPHDFIGFDEITQFTYSQYFTLKAWKRTIDPNQRTRIVATGNPPTTEDGIWVIDYWAPWLKKNHPNPARAGELRWFAMVENRYIERENGAPFVFNGETIFPESRTFIPARVSDNPYYVNTQYHRTLQNIPEPLRSQLLKGDFSVSQQDDPWQVIPRRWIEAAVERWKSRSRPRDAQGKVIPFSVIGVDVARGGDDKTVIARRAGSYFDVLRKYPGVQTPTGPDAAQLVIQAIEANCTPVINVDVIGVGSSVYDFLKGHNLTVNSLQSAERSSATDRLNKFHFANLRAEMWWKFREALDPASGEEIALPDDPELISDLCAPRFSVGISGIKIESKEQIKERLGRSPDSGEAVIYCAYVPPQVGLAFV